MSFIAIKIIKLSVIILSIVMLSLDMLIDAVKTTLRSVVILNVIVLNVVEPLLRLLGPNCHMSKKFYLEGLIVMKLYGHIFRMFVIS